MVQILILYILYILFFPIFSWAQINGSVATGTTLTADEKSSPWLSPLGDFAFGFKQLQDKDQFLFSIWFNKIPDQTVVWYLNTINPVVPRGSSIRVDSKAGLVLLDPQNGLLWSTIGIDVQTDQGFLENTGNFILKGSDGSLLWESFKVYGDTILPGQELGIGDALRSLHSEKNFTNGRFHLRFADDGNLVLTSKRAENDDGDDYYSSEISDAGNSSNSGSRAGLDQRGSIYVMRKSGQITPLSLGFPSPASHYIRATLEYDGVFLLYSHPKNFTATSAIWNIVWSVPDNICEAIMGWQEQSGACGYNNICSLQGVRSSCNCPKGYHLVDPNDKYGDCQPNFTASCDKQGSDVVMLEQVNIDWPLSDYFKISPATEMICKQACLDDCLCTVAIFRGNNCWKKKLPLANGKVYLNTKAFIKSASWRALPPYPVPVLPGRSKHEEKTTWVIVASALGGCSLFVLVLIAAIFLAFYLRYQKRNRITAVETSLCCFTFQELAEATREFGVELGSGSFGVVYKGELAIRSRSIHVAVKKLNRLAQEKEFRAEVNSIGQTNHKNLVRLLGFCHEGKHRLLVYEYMSNGSLASFLFFENKPGWSMRKHIATGIARGLEYLHEECSVQIIHCDIKPENILLDEYYNVRISDFGLAKLMETDQSRATLTNIRGTRGYIAPEWFSNSQITAKVDVYSFGVLLLEIISCRKRVKRAEQSWDLPLTDLAWDCFENQCLDSFVGNDDMEPLKEEMMLERYVMVGLWCIQENPSLRPTMRKVSQMLEGIMEIEIPPCPNPVSSSV